MNELATRIKEIVGEEHFDEFEIEVRFEFGKSEEWDCEEELIELANLCHEWYTDSKLILARKIENSIRVEFKKGSHTYFNLPSWRTYDSVYDMLDTAEALVSTHELDVMYLPEFKDYFDIEDEETEE